MADQKKKVKIFYCYDPKDSLFLNTLEIWLGPLERSEQIETWGAHNMIGGTDRDSEIDRRLSEADIVLLLVSPDFNASEECDAQQKRAIELLKIKATFYVIPIILRHSQGIPDAFKNFQSLPKNERPIKDWADKDEAFREVYNGIKEVVEQMLDQPRQASDVSDGFIFIGHYPTGGYQWDNDLRPAPGLVEQQDILDAPWLVSRPIGILEIHQRYSLFEKRDALYEFAHLGSDKETILQFANKHGYLKQPVPLVYPEKVGQPDSFVWQGESFQTWMGGIEEMKFFLTLWEMIKGRQIEELKKYIIWRLETQTVHFIAEHRGRKGGSLLASKDVSPQLLYQWGWGEVLRPALYYLRKEITERTKGHLNLTLFPSPDNGTLISMVPDCLFNALYTLLSLEMRDHPVEPG